MHKDIITSLWSYKRSYKQQAMSVADLEGAQPAQPPPSPLWAMDRCCHDTPDK